MKTDDRRAALVEKVARVMADRAGASYSWEWYRNQGIAAAALNLILDEAAKTLEYEDLWHAAFVIRALKGGA